MAYIINRFDGTQLAIVDDGILDTSTPLGLIGRNYTGYGEVQNENFIFLLENFANDSPPARALSGQAWYDKSAKTLKVFNGTNWLSIGNSTVAEIEPDHSNGGLWLKSTTQQLFVSDGTVWRQVGPEAAEGFAVTKMTSTVIKDTLGANKPVILSQVNGETVAVIVNEDFAIGPDFAIPGFSQLSKGINLKSTTSFSGALKGNADSATKLESARQINGVDFNGTSDITITSATNQPLKPGDYIVGSEFNGAFEQTWNINAESENILGTVVARNSVGGFSATTITSDLFGNVQGNVTALSGTSTFNNLIANIVTANSFNGNATTASKIRFPKKINTVDFDGSADITLPVPADTLTTDTLATNVVNSSLTNLGKLEYLEVEAPGIIVGDGNNLNIRIEGFTPTLESDVSNALKLKLATGSVTVSPTTVTFISANAANADGVLSPALVPDYTLGTSANQRPVLGLPSHRWRDIYSAAATLDNLKTSTISGRTLADQVTFTKDVIVTGTTYGALVGNVTGNLVGNVTGAASLNLLKSGDTMAGDMFWNTTGRGLIWSMNSDSASIKYYNLGDGDTNSRLEFNTSDNTNEFFRWTHTVGASTYESMRLTPNTSGSADLNITGTVNVSGNINISSGSSTFQGRGSGITDLNAFNLASGTVPPARLSGNYAISVTGNLTGNVTGNLTGSVSGTVTGNVVGAASLNILKTGDTLSGDLNWSTSGRGLTWGMNSDGASIRFYNVADGDTASRLEFQTTDNGNEYFSWTHLLSGGSTVEAMRLVPNTLNGTSSLRVYGNITVDGTASGTFSGSGVNLDINAEKLGVGTVPRGRLSGTYDISVSGNSNYATSAGSAAANIQRTGDTMTGRLGQHVNGFHAASIGAINNRTNSGFFDNPSPSVADGWPAAGSWHHLLSSTHVNDANYYAMQFSADFYSQNLYYRSTAGNGNTAWNKVLLSSNYNEYAPTKTGGGASGTWAINISGNATTVSSVPWTSVTGKPSIVSNDGGTYGINISGTAAAATTAPKISNLGNVAAESNGSAEPSSALTLRSVYTNGYPTSYGNALTLGGAGGGELLVGWSGTTGGHADNYVRSRRDTGNTWSAWAKLLTDVNFNSYAPTTTGGNASGTWPISITGNANSVTTISRNQIVTALGYDPVNPSTLTNTSGAVGNFSAVTATGDVTISKSNPTLFLNHNSGGYDSGIELAISVQEENFIIYEPDDGNREWFRINDTGSNGHASVYGNTILDANNYTTYVPTKTGTGASGTWPISISGNAVTVSSVSYQQVINALGFTPANNSDLTRITTSPLQASNATITGTLTVAQGADKGIRWPNDSYGGGYDTARITLESVGGESTRMRFTMTNDADDYFEFSSPSNNGLKMNGYTVHSDINTYFTSGISYSTAGFTNQVGSFNDSRNYFDVYPPAGYAMYQIMAFIPSINHIHFAGGVNGDDSMRCTYIYYGDRIRVFVQNTEQRSTPAASWLAIWRR